MKSRFFCVYLIFTCIHSTSWAEEDGTKSRELSELRAVKAKIGADVEQLQTEKSTQIDQLRQIEKQYGEHLKNLNRLKNDIQQHELAIKDINNHITQLQHELLQHRRILEGLIKSAYSIGDRQGSALILNQADPAASGRLIVYYNYLTKARLQKLQTIREQTAELQKLESEKMTESEALHVNLRSKQQEADQIKILKSEREVLLSQIEHDFIIKQQQLAHLLHDEKKLETLLATLPKTVDNGSIGPTAKEYPDNNTAKSEKQADRIKVLEQKQESQAAKFFADMQGQLPWPVQGGIIERFGNKRFETHWDGALIGAREGSDVHAISAGKVIYSDWLRGYGLMIIVDHGQGFMSLYAYNQSLYKNVGEAIRTGETLASVGRSGGRSQAALYFGIRKNGKALDPEKWCRKPGTR